MSPRTRIVSFARPGPAATIVMPSPCEARSRVNIASAACSARRCASPMSAARELRDALLRERGDALGIVARVAELTLVIALDVELLLVRTCPAAVDGLLGAGEPTRRRVRQSLREFLDIARELGVVDAAPDQAPLLRVLRAE